MSNKEYIVNICSYFFSEPFPPSCEIWKDIKFTNGGRDGGDLVNVWSLDGWLAASISGHQPPSSAQLTILGSKLGHHWDIFGMAISVWDGSQVSTIPFEATSPSSCAQLTILGVKQKNYKFTKITKSSQVHFRQAAFAQLTIIWLKSSIMQCIRVRIKSSRNSNDHILTFFSHYRFPPLPVQARTIPNIFVMNNLKYEDEKHRRAVMRWKHEQRLNGIYHRDHVLWCQTI